MKTILLVATTNSKKLKELQKLLANLPVELKDLKSLSHFKEVVEDGKSFQENAAKKALGYASQSGWLTLGEDSGLCCDALEGAPGIYSARFSGPNSTDQKNNEKILKLFEKIPDNCRGAKFVSAIALAVPGKVLTVVQDEVRGFIHRESVGSQGFGYDSLFYYPDFKTTFANVASEKKDAVSHRAKALLKAKKFLSSYLQKISPNSIPTA